MDSQVKETFQRGVAAFKRAEYELSVSLFTEAIEKSSGTQVMFESRSAASEKVGDIVGALKDARKVIDLAPASPQGYMRSAKLFLLAGRPRSALKMVELASSRVQTSDTKRVEKLTQLRAEVDAAVSVLERRERRKMCHISQLPFEIVSEIMLTAFGSGTSSLLTLASICSHWRSVAVGTGPLWRTVRLGTRDPVKQLEAWTQRSASSETQRGVLHLTIPHLTPITAQRVYTRWCVSPRFKIDLLTPLSLELEGESREVAQMLSKSIVGIPAGLRTLISKGDAPELIDIGEAPQFQQLHHLELECISLLRQAVPSTQLQSLISLRLPQLLAAMSVPDFVAYIKGIPALQELDLGCERFLLRPGDDDPAESPTRLNSLKRLALRGRSMWLELLAAIDAPALTHLDLSGSSNDVCATLLRLWVRANCVPPRFIHLRLGRCGVGYQSISLRAVVVQLPLLEKLIVTDCGDDINPTLLVLAGKNMAQPAASSQTPAVLPCPRLQYVDFSRCSQLKGTAIRDLVKSRLAIATSPSENGSEEDLALTIAAPRALPIQTLLIDQCPKVPADLLPWLREQVPRMSCVYETRAQVRERMPRMRS